MKNDIARGEATCNIIFQSAIKMILYKPKCDIYFIIYPISDLICQNRYHQYQRMKILKNCEI